MFIVGLLQWWYTDGWRRRSIMLKERLDRTMDYFSISLLIKTMFSLFRQDGAGSVNGPLSVKINAFFGRLISRAIGAMIRSAVLIIGCFTIAFTAIGGMIALALWSIVPLVPIIGALLALTGWMPWR